MRVCVIGAGPSGLTTVKQLLDEGHDVTCFEKSDGVGGIWHRNGNDANEMKVFDSLMLTISRKLMSFSDFMIKGPRVFLTHAQYLSYLQAYADEFALRNHIELVSTVTKVAKVPGGQYDVTVTSNGKETVHRFEAVAICSGPFQKPNYQVAGLEQFTGNVVHSFQYRHAKLDVLEGKRCMVVGLAESGADILREVSNVAADTTLAIREYSYLLSRLVRGKYATDSLTVRAHHYEAHVRSTELPFPMDGLFGKSTMERKLFLAAARVYGVATAGWAALAEKLGGEEDPGTQDGLNNMQQPMHPRKLDIDAEWNEEHVAALEEWNRRSHPKQIIYCKNASFIPNIVNGKILINDTGIESIHGKLVTFKNGETKEVDTIVLCTGFKKDFSILGADLEVPENNVRNLYKHCFHPDHGGRLAFMGFVRPYTGGIPIVAEMQARYFAQLCSGKNLPDDVRERIQKEKAWEQLFTMYSPRHTEAIPTQAFFIDAMAKEIGCLPSVADLVRNPKLLVRTWFYTYNQASYRLKGPHAMPKEAMEEIMSETRGPRSRPSHIAWYSLLSMLPHFIKFKGNPTAIGAVRDDADPPPKGPNFGRVHSLTPGNRCPRSKPATTVTTTTTAPALAPVTPPLATLITPAAAAMSRKASASNGADRRVHESP